ncbi:hypothetical protein EBR16_06450 [bacterium]|nr:hypothetical protein [bacterium]
MSQPRLEIAVRRAHPDDEEPDRLPLRWSTIARLLAFTAPHRGQRNTLLVLCALRAMALPLLAWMVGAIIRGPVTAGDGAAIKIDGQMIDKPVIDRAHALLARARRRS